MFLQEDGNVGEGSVAVELDSGSGTSIQLSVSIPWHVSTKSPTYESWHKQSSKGSKPPGFRLDHFPLLPAPGHSPPLMIVSVCPGDKPAPGYPVPVSRFGSSQLVHASRRRRRRWHPGPSLRATKARELLAISQNEHHGFGTWIARDEIYYL